MENDLEWIKHHLGKLEGKVDTLIKMDAERRIDIAVLKTKSNMMASFWGLVGSAIAFIVNRQI